MKSLSEFVVEALSPFRPPGMPDSSSALPKQHASILGECWGLDKPGAKQRHHRQRHEVRSKQRQTHRQRQRGKQEPADAIEECHREKYDRARQRGGQHRQRDFLRRLSLPLLPEIRPIRDAGRYSPSTITALSMSRENTSAKPARIIVLMELPPQYSAMMAASADSGIERNTATVARRLPRKIKTISAVSKQPDPSFVEQRLDGPS